jgi:hypothetical protein
MIFNSKLLIPFVLGAMATVIIYECLLTHPISAYGLVTQDEPEEPVEGSNPIYLPYVNMRIYLDNIPSNLVGVRKVFSGKIYYHKLSAKHYLPVINVTSSHEMYSTPPH